MNRVRGRRPGRWRAFVYAVVVHIAVAATLIIGFRFSGNSPLPPGKPVNAVAVEDPKQRKLEDDEKRRQAEDKRKAEELRRAEEIRQREQAERQRAEQVRKEDEARRAEEQRRVEQRQKEEADKKHQAEVKRKQEEERRLEQERRKQEEVERRQAAEDALKQQIAAEERARADAARAARAASEQEKFKLLIRQKVSRNWHRPPGTTIGLKCTVRVRLAPGGEVLQAQVIRSSGNPVFDRSVENAVYKAAPLPLPPDPDLFVYFREIEFLFSPES